MQKSFSKRAKIYLLSLTWMYINKTAKWWNHSVYLPKIPTTAHIMFLSLHGCRIRYHLDVCGKDTSSTKQLNDEIIAFTFQKFQRQLTYCSYHYMVVEFDIIWIYAGRILQVFLTKAHTKIRGRNKSEKPKWSML